MKRIEIKTINDFFATLKLNAFSKETRSTIVKNHLKISKVVKETEELSKAITDKLISENQEDIQKLLEKRELFRISSESEKQNVLKDIINECQVGLRVESEVNELVKDLLNENVEIDLIKFEQESFIDECAEAGVEFTLSDFDRINVLFN